MFCMGTISPRCLVIDSNDIVEGFWGFPVIRKSLVRGALVELVEILVECLRDLAILSIMLLPVFMQMATISNWCLVRL